MTVHLLIVSPTRDVEIPQHRSHSLPAPSTGSPPWCSSRSSSCPSSAHPCTAITSLHSPPVPLSHHHQFLRTQEQSFWFGCLRRRDLAGRLQCDTNDSVVNLQFSNNVQKVLVQNDTGRVPQEPHLYNTKHIDIQIQVSKNFILTQYFGKFTHSIVAILHPCAVSVFMTHFIVIIDNLLLPNSPNGRLRGCVL